jgi:acyl-CoA thioesterase-1
MLVSLLTAPFAWSQNLEPARGNAPAPKPVNPALVQVEDVPGLPRVFIIGDSISIGYTLAVRELLEGQANLHRPTENCGDTARGLARVEHWLGDGDWDVIHFNFGLHDLKYLDENGKYVDPEVGKQVAPPEVYRKQLTAFTLRLMELSDAELIFATTTPIPPGAGARVAGDEAVYNQVAFAVMEELDVTVNDLCAYVMEHQKNHPLRPLSEKPTSPEKVEPRPDDIQLPFNVHFTKEGSDQLAALVAEHIKEALAQRTDLVSANSTLPSCCQAAH